MRLSTAFHRVVGFVLTSAALSLTVDAAQEIAGAAREPRLEVVVHTADGQPATGAVAELCVLPRDRGRGAYPPAVAESSCRHAVVDTTGVAVLEAIEPGVYALRTNLSGFADTVVAPLNIASDRSTEGAAPKRVVVVLNPVCYDC